MSHTDEAVTVTSNTWQANKPLALVLRSLAFLIPLLGGWLVVATVSDGLFRPSGFSGAALWAVQALIIGSCVAGLVDRFSRRLVPLSALFRTELVFPDHAPSRFEFARRIGSKSRLESDLAGIKTGDNFEDEPAQQAAERALALVSLLGLHDRSMRGHSERVRNYVDLIAAEMDVPEDDRAKMSWAALLHDVGKLKIDPVILASRNEPTEDQWYSVKEHPAHSADLMRSLFDWLGDAFGAATEHHERWDGTGYPQQLAGVEISLAGRITAVADAFDAMTATRSYKHPMSVSEARQALMDSQGTQFDPAVVRAFLNVSLGRNWAVGPLGWLSEKPGLAINSLGVLPTMATAAILAAAFAVGAISTPADKRPPAELASVDADSQEPESTSTTSTSGNTADGVDPNITTTDSQDEPSTTALATTETADIPTTEPGSPATPPTTSPPTSTVPVSYPSASDDSYTTGPGDWVVMQVLDNDDSGDFEWDTETLDFYIEPEHGDRWEKLTNGRLRYKPAIDFAGADTFKYVVCNKGGHCAIGTVTVAVEEN